MAHIPHRCENFPVLLSLPICRPVCPCRHPHRHSVVKVTPIARPLYRRTRSFHDPMLADGQRRGSSEGLAPRKVLFAAGLWLQRYANVRPQERTVCARS